MNTLNGYSKSTLSNDYLLTASGGHLPKSDLFIKLGINLDINTFADNSNKNGIIYINTATPNDINAPFGYGSILSLNNLTSSWMVACSADGTLSYRSRWWSGNGNDWSDWKTLLTTNGGTLTGPLVLNGSDTDRNLIRINCEIGDANKIGNWGYTLKYLGSGTGINNALALYADNSEATIQNLATKWLNDGTMYSRSIIPHLNATYDLGTNDIKWNNICGTTIYENGTNLASKYQVKGSYAITNNTPTIAVDISAANNTGIYYVNGTSDILDQSDGALITNKYNDSWISQIYQDYRTGKIALRGKKNGTWMPWLKPSYEGHTHNYLPLTGGVIKNGATRNPLTIDTTNEVGSYINFATNGIAKAYVGYNSSAGAFMEENSVALKLKDGVATLGNYIMLHSGNYNSYAPKLDGTGASGTWGINITGSATTASYLPEAKLTWGGKNFAASWGPIDAAMIPELGSNRLEYYPGSKIKIEYSTDNGSTWSASTLSETTKSQIFSSGYSIYLGGSNATKVDKSQYQTRIILTTAGTLYSTLNKFAIRASTSGSSNCWCSIDVRLQSNVENNTDTWVNVANKVAISGWSGWNIINIGGFTTYGNQKASQYGEIRFTFGATHSNLSEYPGLTILKIKGFGGEGWATPSNKASTGTIYIENSDQTTIWPNTLYPWSNKTSNLGVNTRYWNNIYAAHVYIGGTNNNTTSKITSDTATNMYFDVGEVIALMVLNGSDKTIRSGTSHANTVNLGASNVPFKSLYVNDAYLSKALTLTGITSDTACINFSRSTNVASYGYNYITAPVGGIISIQPGLTPSSSTGYHFTSTEIIPGATDTYSLGTSSLQFKNVYATTFNGYTIEKSVPSNAIFTDYQTTQLGHYTPLPGNEFGLSDSNHTLSFGDQVVTAIVGDDKGHVTGTIVSYLPQLPSNNVVGTGSRDHIAKFSDANTITIGPKFGTDNTTYLRNDGTWARPYNNSKTTLSYSGRAATEIQCAETISIPAYSWCHIKVYINCPSVSSSNSVPFQIKLADANTPATIYDMTLGLMLSGFSGSPGVAEMWYYNNTTSQITTKVHIYNSTRDIPMQILSSVLYMGITQGTLSNASYYEIIS